MKILYSIKTGMMRSLKSWKGIVIIWFVSVLVAGLVAFPMKASLNAGLGSSTITERLKDGVDIEVFADMGEGFKSLSSYFSRGMIMIIVIVFVTNSFLSGGLFNSLRASSERFSVSEFFMSSARRFWSFLLLSVILSLIIILLALIILAIPLAIITQSENISEAGAFKTGMVLVGLFLLLLAVVLVIADYARAWQVVNENNCFKALGFGIRNTFRTFLSSFPLILILMAVQAFFLWLVLQIIPTIKPVSGAGIIVLFVISQFLYFVRLLLKTWRYGSMTVMMERSVKIDGAF